MGTAFLVVSAFFVAHLCFWVLPAVFEPWNAQVVDRLFMVRNAVDRFRPAYDDTIVHVDINNTTIQRLNNFYLGRSYYARAIDSLAGMGVAAQIYDFIFASRRNEGEDRALIDTTAAAGNVYYGMALALSGQQRGRGHDDESVAAAEYVDRTKWHVHVKPGSTTEELYTGAQALITFPELANASRGLGFISIKSDRDGVFRRAPLLVKHNEAFYPSLSLRVVCDYLDVPPEQILVEPGRSITLRGAHRPGGGIHDVVIPIDRHGNMIINFIGAWERMKHYNFADVLQASESREKLDAWRKELSGKLVVVSDVSTGSTDIGPVPTDVNFPLGALHANILHTILTEDFLVQIPGAGMLLIETVLLAIVLFLASRSSSLSFSMGALGLASCYVVIAAILFLYTHIVVHMLRPLFFLAFATVSVTAYRYVDEQREKEALRRTFEAYFPPSVVKKIISDPDAIARAGQRKELTILFSDIEDFTARTIGLSPEQIRRTLNEYFEAMVDIVFGHEGTVDKYIGDGLMVFFGDPDPQPDHALRAVCAAVEMQMRVRELRERWEEQGGLPIRIRIGINTGEVVVGNMGSMRRLSYTVLGAAVNVAKRLESKAPAGGIMIAQRTYELVKEDVETRALGEIEIKGIDHPVSVYEIPADHFDFGEANRMRQSRAESIGRFRRILKDV